MKHEAELLARLYAGTDNPKEGSSMSSIKVGDLVAPNGTYEKDGETKTRWLKCGVVLDTAKGMRVKLEAIPTVRSDDGHIWFSVFQGDER